ncbi:MAG TPA: fused response regulator/phosphatase [Chitinophagaceae bacterium]|nr:fused response regulator/phosphatase [Chitinophagaceae bacterium]
MIATLKKILLVDDSAFMLAMLANAFEKESFMVIKAASANEALTILETHKPDIILSDYEMPIMNGFIFRQLLLKNPATKDIPFVFLTTHKENELVMKGLGELQAVDFINKDTPIPVIISKLDNLLSTVRQKQAHAVEELRKAAEAINVKSIPTKGPSFKSFEVGFWHEPYHGYPGGDFIDFIKVNDRYTYIILGDVMGKKWIAWFFTFSYLSYIRATVRFLVSDEKTDPAYILQKINQAICKDEVLKDVLAGLSLLLVDEQTSNVKYAGAGDVPLLFYKAAEDELTTVKTSGLLLGLFSNAVYDSHDITLKPGDRLLVFSDGLIDFTEESGKRKSDYELFKKNVHPYLKMDRSFTIIRGYLQGLLKDGRQADDASVISIYKK